MYSPREIIDYWLSNRGPSPSYGVQSHWFNIDRGFERYIRRRLMAYVVLASEESLKEWQDSPEGTLALTLLLDRFSRLVYRGTVMEYENEIKARRLALFALDRRRFSSLTEMELVFQLFPLLSSERLNHQLLVKDFFIQLKAGDLDQNADELLTNLISLIDRNVLLIRKFGRFPHRTQKQGIALNPDEEAFVSQFEWQYWL